MTEAVLIQKNEPIGAESAALPRQLPDMTGVAEKALTWGLELCAKRMGLNGPEATVYHLQRGDSIAHAYCCYDIAQQIAESLGSRDEHIKAVYTLDYDATPERLHLVYPHTLKPLPKARTLANGCKKNR